MEKTEKYASLNELAADIHKNAVDGWWETSLLRRYRCPLPLGTLEALEEIPPGGPWYGAVSSADGSLHPHFCEGEGRS
jgi:hypothetical protein